MSGITPRQQEYLIDLLEQREVPNAQELHDRIVDADFTMAEASAQIDHLKSCPRKQRKTQAEPEAGMYRLDDGTIVRVYLGQQSGKMLAKRLVETPEEQHTHEYEYMGLAVRFVKPDTARLSLEEAKKFGRMTGTCCVCARRLDNPESVEAGIGPVCASKF